MSAADFLLAPEVQKILKVVLATPDTQFSADALAKKAKLDGADLQRTQEHLVKCGILIQQKAKADEPETVSANTSFVFYEELRKIALKSFAAAEPIRAMLRSKFKSSVLRAFILGEDKDATVELLVVHGESMPDEGLMSAACQKLSASIGRHLQVHVISSKRFAALAGGDGLGAKLSSAIEIIAEGDTKAKLPAEPESLFQSTKKRLAFLAR